MPVYKRGKHYWVFIQHQGQMHRFSCRGATLEQAKALEAKARQDIIRGRLGQTRRSIEEALTRWLEGEARTLKDYRKIAQTVQIILPHLQDTDIENAQDAAARIREAYKHLSPATINRRLAILRRIVNLAWEWGWIQSPIKISLQTGEQARSEYLTRSQVFRLARHARRSRWHIIFAAYTGMRQGEILSLSADDIGKDAVLLRETKSSKPRLVPLNRLARIAMRYMDFTIGYDVLRRDFEYARKLNGLENIRFHDLRHTAASFMVAGGANLAEVRDILGHSNLQVTSRYSHLGIDGMRKAVDKMLGYTKTAQYKRKSVSTIAASGARSRNRTGTT